MTSPVVRLRDVTRSFPGPPEVQALKGINLSIDAGEYVSIVGPSGSGKSTLLNVLGLLDRPSVGEYTLAGDVTGSLSDDARTAVRASRIGFVFQSFHLLPRRSVLENVQIPMLYNHTPRAQREHIAREAIARVGLSHRLDFLPPVLSGGERQRVAVARAVANRPALLLADEPTGSLDRDTTAEILSLFDDLHADGLTIVMITHDEAVAQRTQRRIRIDGGRMSE